jgi:hypothetical protein
MESIMCERNEEIAMQRSLEEQTSLDEIIKKANCSLDSQELFNQCLAVVAENECFDKDVDINLQIIVVVGCLTNKTKGPLSILASHKYAGHIVKHFPNPLNSSGAFTMSSMSDKGVKAAVVYSGKNKAGVECGWLLAFADTKATGRRVSTQACTVHPSQKSFPFLIFQKHSFFGKKTHYNRKSDWTMTWT